MIAENPRGANASQEESDPERWLITREDAALEPLSERLDAYVDKRLITTCIDLIAAIICHVPRDAQRAIARK